ncbi:MAG: polysaccharide biosynthesis tyrosine autokinase [Solirubrobacteraceae bacterium]
MTEHQALSSPRDFLTALWRWKFLVAACLVSLPLAAYRLASGTRPQYQSSVLMQIQGPPVDTSPFATVQSNTTPESVVLSAARLITTSAVADAAAAHLSPEPADPRALLNQVTATPDTAGGFITITVKDGNPQRAGDIANAFAQAVVEGRTREAVSQLDSAIGQLVKQVAGLRPGDVQGRNQLSQQLQRFRALRAAQGSNASIVEPAVAGMRSSALGVTRAVLLGLLIAALIAIGLVLLAERVDRKIRNPADLEAITSLPLLSAIPPTAFANLDDGTPADIEAFRTLRAALTYFNIDRRISSVLITSAGKQEGKTTVSINLALAMARAGKDVILVDVDFRRPAAAQRLGITPSVGLGSVLVDTLSLEDALKDVPSPGLSGGRLRVLPAGPPPPNPSELIGSQRMHTLVAELEDIADVVILDSAPLLVVSDSLPLLEAVSGIVLIARINRTHRAALTRLGQVITSAGGNALGVVATDAASGGLYGGYGYGSGYSGPHVPQADAGFEQDARLSAAESDPRAG